MSQSKRLESEWTQPLRLRSGVATGLIDRSFRGLDVPAAVPLRTLGFLGALLARGLGVVLMVLGRQRRRVAQIALLALLGGAAQAQTTIDSFTTNQAALSEPPTSIGSIATGGADIIGTRRGLLPRLLAGAGPTTVSVAGGNVVLTVTNTTPNSRGEARLSWDGDSNPNALTPNGLGGVNLSSGNSSGFRLRFASLTVTAEVEITVYGNGTNFSRATRRVPVSGSALDVLIPFAEFRVAGGTGAAFSSVGAIEMVVRAGEGTVTLNELTTTAPAVAATKTDVQITDLDSDTSLDPGDRVRYTVKITNTGNQALNVDLNDTVDSNTTLVPGSVSSTPIAHNDQYGWFGNVTLSTDGTAFKPHLLANDQDPDGDTVTVQVGTFPATSAQGGTLTLVNAATGAFAYSPPAGFSGVDSFNYTIVDDNSNTSTAAVHILLDGVVWFVDASNSTPPHLGTQADPFQTLAALLGGVGDPDQPGDVVFLFNDAGTPYAGGLVLEANQTLIGEEVGLILGGITIVPAGGTPRITNAAGVGLTLATNNSVSGVTITGTSGAGIFGSNFGTFTATSLDVTSTGGAALDLSNGSISGTYGTLSSTGTAGQRGINLVTIAGSLNVSTTSLTNPTTDGILVSGSGTGTFSFGATTITDTNTAAAPVADGIDVATGNAGAMFNFSSLSVTADDGTGLRASNSGTINISGTGNSIVSTGGPAVDIFSTSLGSGATFATLTSTNSAGVGVNLNAVTGAFTANGGSITNPAGIAFDLNAGSANVAYAGAISNTANALLIDVTARTGGTTTFSGNLSSNTGGNGINVSSSTGGTINFTGATKTLNTSADTAVNLATNTGATINFTGGGLDIDTTSGTGFSATGGATAITVQGGGNSITSTTGTALNVASTAIGASGLTFQSISSNGGTNGIVLNNTGVLAALTVTGAGAVDSGGTLLNKSGDAISLNQTGPVSISRMRIEDNLGNGIFGSSVNGLSLAHVRVIDNADNDAIDEAGVHLVNLLGTSSWTSIEVADSLEDNARILNSGSNHLTQLTISNSVFRDTSAASPGNNGLLIQADGSANMTADVSTTDFLRNRANGIQIINNGTGTVDVEIGGAGSDFTDNNIGINIAHNGPSPGRLFFDVSSGNFNSTLASPINLNLGGATTAGSVMEGNVLNTVIDNNDSLTGPGIRVTTNGGGTMTVLLENNQISEVANRGIEMIARDGSSTLNASLFRNNINLASALAADAVHIAAGAISTDTVSVCADINGDNIVANRNSVFSAGINGIRVRQRFTGTSFTLEDYAGGPTDVTAVQNFLTARNVGGDTYVADFAGAGFGTIANCPMPAP